MRYYFTKLIFWLLCKLAGINDGPRKRWVLYHEFHNGGGAGKRPLTTKQLMEWLLFETKRYGQEFYEIKSNPN